MKVGLIGMPNSGVTTFFCLFTGRSSSLVAPNPKNEVKLGEIKVPDARLDALAAIFKPRSCVYATIEFADVPVELDESGAFSTKTLTQLRNMDALAVVIRAFENPAVPHHGTAIDPLKDLQSFYDEAILTDLLQIEKRLERLQKEGRVKSQEGDLLGKLKTHLEASSLILKAGLGAEETKLIAGYRFITEKPWLILFNIEAGGSGTIEKAGQYCDEIDFPWLDIAAKVELEIQDLAPEDRAEFLADLGVEADARDRFIRGTYKYLNLISFPTVGEDECRAWTVESGSNAVTAAGKIHTDLARGFIRADVISYDDFMMFKDLAAAKKAGKFRLEGKNYIVRDGDIMDIRFSV
jgi:ribosome-binding ATPase